MTSCRKFRLPIGTAFNVLMFIFNLLFIGHYLTINSGTNLTAPGNVPEPDGYSSADLVSQDLQKRVRVLCWVLTTPFNHKTKARAIKNTWGPRCNVLLFMSTEEDASLPTIALKTGEGRYYLWDKVRAAFFYVWAHYRDQADWFYKVDDDAYVVVENLRFMLSAYNTSEPIHLGYKFKAEVEGGYNSGGPGYVLSKEALKRFVQQGLSNNSICQTDPTFAEDVVIGKCLHSLGVKNGDSRDSHGRDRFSPLNVRKELFPGKPRGNYWCVGSFSPCLSSLSHTSSPIFYCQVLDNHVLSTP